MIYAYLAFIFAVFLAVQYLRERMIAAERKAWAEERRELLTRIQAPDRIPVAARPEFVIPDPVDDEWNKVGTITHDPDYGLDG